MHLFKQFRAAGGNSEPQDRLMFFDFQSINNKVVEVTKATGASTRWLCAAAAYPPVPVPVSPAASSCMPHTRRCVRRCSSEELVRKNPDAVGSKPRLALHVAFGWANGVHTDPDWKEAERLLAPRDLGLGFLAAGSYVFAGTPVSKMCREGDCWSRLPLHAAMRNKPPLEVVGWLLEINPAACCAKDLNGDTPLHLALKNAASPEVVQRLVDVQLVEEIIKDGSPLWKKDDDAQVCDSHDCDHEFGLTKWHR
jgi:hypothetical protein